MNELRKSPSKLYKDFFYKVAHSVTNINTEIFNKYFPYQNPISLLKDLSNTNKTKNKKIVDHVNDALIDLRNAVNKRKFLIMKILTK